MESLLATWQHCFNSKDLHNITKLYTPDATLWGTFSPFLRDNAALIEEYFSDIFRKNELRFCAYHPFHRQFGHAGVSCGYFLIEWSQNQTLVRHTGRFSMTLLQKNGQWQIADYHSSLLPAI
ncbi:DUF4440 domain-containing protein [Desulfurispira natronophila]|uniref:DUF4440 domain-containing protein n=1 Tax=Desulfurispira natronophila TaxID=682562 RepID=A0A7W7Y424_9BACT|nr:nuclear transport factor 2 family protein [Desulfurispira natronophila]MBB5021664.1 hypothetical protein [Desulfurispira natronophila]